MDDLIRIVIVPLSILLAGFILEISAVRTRGVQKGLHKFKAWLRRSDGSYHADSPCSITQIEEYTKHGTDSLVDIVELVSFESYSGISFDLCIAALTSDIVAIFHAQQKTVAPPNLALIITIHLLLLVFVVVLVIANNLASPDQATTRSAPSGNYWYDRLWRDWWYSTVKRRTVLSAFAGLFALVTSFITLWQVL